MVMSALALVVLSSAVTVRMPLASRSKVTATCGSLGTHMLQIRPACVSVREQGRLGQRSLPLACDAPFSTMYALNQREKERREKREERREKRE